MISEVLLALLGHYGKIIILDQSSFELCVDPFVSQSVLLLNPAEEESINQIVSLGSHYLFFQQISSSFLGPSAGLYRAALGSFLQTEILSPYRQLISKIEKEKEENELSLLKIKISLQMYYEVFPILKHLFFKISQENIWGTCISEFLFQMYNTIGSPLVQQILFKFLHQCNLVMFDQLSVWIIEGRLLDPHNEFFIQQGKNEEDNCIVELSFLPSFISPTIAHKILKIGQHMLILHKEEVQSERWKTLLIPFSPKLKELSNSKVPSIAFDSLIEEIYSMVNSEISSLLNRHKLMEYFQAFKNYFLLFKGEFYENFFRESSNLFSNSPVLGAEHDINFIFQQCFKSYDEEYMADSFFLKLDQTTWDSLNLHFKPFWPLNLIFSSKEIDSYSKLFKFIFKLKKIYVELKERWVLIHSWFKSKKILFEGFQSLCLFHSDISHFFEQLLTYYQFYILDSAFSTFISSLNLPEKRNFDSILSLHEEFLSFSLSHFFFTYSSLAGCILDLIKTASLLSQLINNELNESLITNSTKLSNFHKKFNNISQDFYKYRNIFVKLLPAIPDHKQIGQVAQLLTVLDFNQFYSKRLTN